ncbi:MAG TPA: hypothetical protein VII99_14175 [Bacteroidia bacterium]
MRQSFTSTAAFVLTISFILTFAITSCKIFAGARPDEYYVGKKMSEIIRSKGQPNKIIDVDSSGSIFIYESYLPRVSYHKPDYSAHYYWDYKLFCIDKNFIVTRVGTLYSEHQMTAEKIKEEINKSPK